MSTRGIDVSHHNGRIDWRTVAASGTRFVIVKATEGAGYTDETLVANVRDAKSAGLQVAVYHFARADQDGRQQAEHFLAAICDLVPDLGIHLPDGRIVRAFLDLEDGPEGYTLWRKVPYADRVGRVGAFLVTVDKALGGVGSTGIYCSPKWFDGTYAHADWSRRPLWIARYRVKAPGTCGRWARPAIWQHDDHGRVPGVPGDVDLNVML